MPSHPTVIEPPADEYDCFDGCSGAPAGAVGGAATKWSRAPSPGAVVPGVAGTVDGALVDGSRRRRSRYQWAESPPAPWSPDSARYRRSSAGGPRGDHVLIGGGLLRGGRSRTAVTSAGGVDRSTGLNRQVESAGVITTESEPGPTTSTAAKISPAITPPPATAARLRRNQSSTPRPPPIGLPRCPTHRSRLRLAGGAHRRARGRRTRSSSLVRSAFVVQTRDAAADSGRRGGATSRCPRRDRGWGRDLGDGHAVDVIQHSPRCAAAQARASERRPISSGSAGCSEIGVLGLPGGTRAPHLRLVRRWSSRTWLIRHPPHPSDRVVVAPRPPPPQVRLHEGLLDGIGRLLTIAAGHGQRLRTSRS